MHNAAYSVVASGRGGPYGKGSRGMGSERNETHYQVLLLLIGKSTCVLLVRVCLIK